MKRFIIFIIFSAYIATTSSCSILMKRGFNAEQLAQATASALTAASITNAQVVALSQKTVEQLDKENKLAPESYQKRVDNLLKDVKIDGYTLNYKVYKTDEVNAFACGDGSIRIYSGLMDIMDDSELMAIIGHECGHVVHQDTMHAMKKAYLANAARNAVGAMGGTIGALTNSALGDLGEAFLGSQYSQKQEYKADEYGYKFSTENGYSPYSMCNALEKLVKLSNGAQSSLVQKMFSSHPDSAERAKRMKIKADTETALKIKK